MKKILFISIMALVGVSAFGQATNKQIKARGGMSIGDERISGTDIIVVDSVTSDGVTPYIWVGGADIADLKGRIADSLNALRAAAIDGATLYVPLLRDTVPTAIDKTLALTDAGKVIVVTAAAVKTITVPPYVDVAFPIGTTILFLQGGAGEIKFAAGAGVTLDFEKDSVHSNTLDHFSFIRKRATNKWNAGGLLD